MPGDNKRTNPDDQGVLWAYRLDDRGKSTPLAFDDVTTTTETQYDWFHIQVDAPGAVGWLRGRGFHEELVEAMTTIGTRPRSTALAGGQLIILRGVNTNPGADPDDMVSLRIWFTERLVLTARRKGRRLLSAIDVRAQVDAGNGPKTPGALLVALTERIADRIADVVDGIDAELTQFETEISELSVSDARRELSLLRRQSAAIRRYLAPQREALDTLFRTRGVLSDDEAYEIREQTDRITRLVEDLDLARERAMVLQEELQNRLAEQQNARMYVLSLVAAIFLPLSFLTGVFGMNVAGLPGTENIQSFNLLALGMLIVAIGLVVIMRWKKWL